MNDLALSLLADVPLALRPTREDALRAALAEVRAAVPTLDAAAYIAIVRRHLGGVAFDDDMRLALRDLGEGFDLLVPLHAGTYWASTEGAPAPPGLYSLAAGIVALEYALDEHAVTPVRDGCYAEDGSDVWRWRERVRVVRRELAKGAADATHATVETRMAARDIEIARVKGTAA